MGAVGSTARQPLMFTAAQLRALGAQSAVLLLDADECGNAAHDQQDDECKQQSRHDAGHIDPDIHHR